MVFFLTCGFFTRRSRTGPPSVATTVAAGDAATAEGADSAAAADVGLTLKLQQKLKGGHFEILINNMTIFITKMIT